jgi:hypothetical protein
MWKQAFVVSFEVLSQQLPWGTEETKDWQVYMSRSEPATSRIRSRDINHSIITFGPIIFRKGLITVYPYWCSFDRKWFQYAKTISLTHEIYTSTNLVYFVCYNWLLNLLLCRRIKPSQAISRVIWLKITDVSWDHLCLKTVWILCHIRPWWWGQRWPLLRL